MSKRGLLQPAILVNFEALGFDIKLDLETLISRFELTELIYLALEIIYKRHLSEGYVNICKRLFPADNGNQIIYLLDKKLNPTFDKLAPYHLTCMQTGLELLKVLFATDIKFKPLDFDSMQNGSDIKGVNLLSILLLINERITNFSTQVSSQDSEENYKDKLANAVAPTLVENSDFSNFDLTVTPFLYCYKATLFLDFCSKNSSLSGYLQKVLSDYGCKNIRTYITVILGLYCENIQSINNYCRFVFSDEEPAPIFFNKLSIDINDKIEAKDNTDYKAFRAKPLIRLSKNEYVVICFPFLFEKLYTSIIFDLSKYYNGNSVREIISKEFTEKQLLYTLLKQIVSPKSPFSLTGEDCDNIDKNYAPDFYVRDWDSIFLFELKDYSFRAQEKASLSYDEILKYLKSQFITKTNGKPGAIKQLIRNIKSILAADGSFVWDTNISKIKKIFPVLVLGNQNYLNFGITYILNRLYHEELKVEGITSKIVNDLLIIDIDTLLLYKKLFSQNNSLFKNCVKNYFRHINKKPSNKTNIYEAIFGYMTPFPQYLRKQYPITSEHLVNDIYKHDIWKN